MLLLVVQAIAGLPTEQEWFVSIVVFALAQHHRILHPHENLPQDASGLPIEKEETMQWPGGDGGEPVVPSRVAWSTVEPAFDHRS